MRIGVVGAGVGGVAASLALARDGHEVVLVDRDGAPDEGPWTTSPWEARPGCPQLNQGHAFLARGMKVLEQHVPDVVETMKAAGGNITDGNLILPPDHHDPDLRSLAIRRPLIDRAIMGALRSQPGVTFRPATVGGPIVEPGEVPRVTGLETTDGDRIATDLVIDASGRRSRFPEWLGAIGAGPAERREPCGILYYGRYYELHADPPPMFAPIAVQGKTGPVNFAIFWQDARIIIIGLQTPTEDREMRALRFEGAFDAAVAAIKPIAPYADPSFSTPVSPVVSLGGLDNMVRSYMRDGRPTVRGFVAIADALCHTDPPYAWGMSMALDQAFRLPGMIREAPDDVIARLDEAVGDELDDRYRTVVQADRERNEHAMGRRPDPDADTQFVVEAGSVLLARSDPGVLARFLRRALALDPPGAMARDPELLEAARAAILESGALDKVRRPSRAELLEIMAAAV